VYLRRRAIRTRRYTLRFDCKKRAYSAHRTRFYQYQWRRSSVVEGRCGIATVLHPVCTRLPMPRRWIAGWLMSIHRSGSAPGLQCCMLIRGGMGGFPFGRALPHFRDQHTVDTLKTVLGAHISAFSEPAEDLEVWPAQLFEAPGMHLRRVNNTHHVDRMHGRGLSLLGRSCLYTAV
jgi:hypothetical protein